MHAMPCHLYPLPLNLTRHFFLCFNMWICNLFVRTFRLGVNVSQHPFMFLAAVKKKNPKNDERIELCNVVNVQRFIYCRYSYNLFFPLVWMHEFWRSSRTIYVEDSEMKCFFPYCLRCSLAKSSRVFVCVCVHMIPGQLSCCTESVWRANTLVNIAQNRDHEIRFVHSKLRPK